MVRFKLRRHLLLTLFMSGTYTLEEVAEKGMFKYYFVPLTASLHALNYCLPIISVDGTFMKNK